MTASTLPEELRSFVEHELKCGHYDSLDDIVAEGLRVLCAHEKLFSEQGEALRAQVAEGVGQAERGELIDGEEALAEIDAAIDREFGRGD
ncbi:MAG: type II toxin-antitoxin system ParD family antitoxin [bacterium]|nr:type II toxin-antitoxin system ParD family antitoxin [bacterium]